MDTASVAESQAEHSPERVPFALWQSVRSFLRLGTLGKRPAMKAFVKGVTAAAIGAITGVVVVLGRRALIDISTVLLALVTLLLLWRWKKLPEPFIVLGSVVTGLAVSTILHH
jgi:chromate transport protein ChrA